jgi:hypothetical protein
MGRKDRLQTAAISDEGKDNNYRRHQRSSGQRSRLRSGGTLKKTLYEIVCVKIMKQNARSSARMWNIKDWTLWKGQPPPKRLKRDSHA